jgi:hypothetical protein
MNCDYCKTEPALPGHDFCSQYCTEMSKIDNRVANIDKGRPKRYRPKKTIAKVCPVCGEDFKVGSSERSQIYCSKKCCYNRKVSRPKEYSKESVRNLMKTPPPKTYRSVRDWLKEKNSKNL